jgi:hypothetical protein
MQRHWTAASYARRDSAFATRAHMNQPIDRSTAAERAGDDGNTRCSRASQVIDQKRPLFDQSGVGIATGAGELERTTTDLL